MLIVSNKLESDRLIDYLNLNRIDSVILAGPDRCNTAKGYIDDRGYRLYNIRSLHKSGKFYYGLTADEAIAVIANSDDIKLQESLIEADKKLIMQGDITIDTDFNLTATLSNRKNESLREATNNPTHNVQLDLKEWSLGGRLAELNRIVDTYVASNLFGTVVEFSVFAEAVGIHKQEVVYWEIRNY